ncbi:RimJ/RimL family protein N-acetyltransferase [Actinomadura hallensis]|uniref:RimJ/RimL family protein N-acetyltransferase n=1 Tax=Actinomadura hallensis TaxID=337895 RepID=A0A543IF62_9ACTN|nr:GNAT family N-acetyltransferase [Actinomadura hallensis]TQM69229.1 RimJ/RimL family protein N-acetyltransferase [Actinomadura hallensis]
MLRPAYPIETERLTLRPFSADDLEGLYAYQSLPEVARFLYWEPRTLEESRTFLRQKMMASTIEKEGDWLVLAVVWRQTGDLMGEVNLQWRSREHRQGEIGYIFNPAFHGKGFATEAAEVVLRLGFEGLDLHRVVGRLDGRNTASARVLERLGMRREAHLRQNEMVKGEWTDEVIYAMLRHEWEERFGGADRSRG